MKNITVTTTPITVTATVTPSAALAWALSRLDWAVEVSATALTIWGRTGTGREGTFTFPLSRPFPLRRISGGIDCCNPGWRTWEEADLEMAAESRAAAAAKLLVRYLAAPAGEAEFNWGGGDMLASSFGADTLAAIGADVRALRLRRPLQAWAPEDRWDDVPSRAPAWAA